MNNKKDLINLALLCQNAYAATKENKLTIKDSSRSKVCYEFLKGIIEHRKLFYERGLPQGGKDYQRDEIFRSYLANMREEKLISSEFHDKISYLREEGKDSYLVNDYAYSMIKRHLELSEKAVSNQDKRDWLEYFISLTAGQQLYAIDQIIKRITFGIKQAIGNIDDRAKLIRKYNMTSKDFSNFSTEWNRRLFDEPDSLTIYFIEVFYAQHNFLYRQIRTPTFSEKVYNSYIKLLKALRLD